MKINLILCDNELVRSDCLNLVHFADDSVDLNKIKGDVRFLDPYIDNGECEELLAIDILDYFPLYQGVLFSFSAIMSIVK